ncbi:MAG: RNA polymerase sigma factor [Saprospiraceae bacterium]
MQPFSNKKTIALLKSSVFLDNDEAMNSLYAVMYRKVLHFILKNSGSEQDADDIFQDSLMVLYKLAKRDQLDNVTNIQSYFFSICRNLWYKALNKKQKTTTLTEEHHLLPEAAMQISTMLALEKSDFLDQLLKSLGESCRSVLIYYYYDRLKMKEIMKRMDFSSEQVAKNKKSRCMKKLKELIAANPGFKDLLN